MAICPGETPSLFDDCERTDPHPARYSESSYTFLNRVDQPYWNRVREQLELWFSRYPPTDASDLAERFRDADPRQHLGAWWELYLFALYSRLGWSVEVHPEVQGTAKRPDFLIKGHEEFYIEARTVFSGIDGAEDGNQRKAWISDIVNKASNPDFLVGLDVKKTGTQKPKDQEIIEPLESWLATLGPDEVLNADATAVPDLSLEVRGWTLEFTAYPRSPEIRGKPGRLLGLVFMGGGVVNDREKIRRALDRKGSRYDDLGKPFVIALLGTSPFADDDDIGQSLFGHEAFGWRVSPEQDGKFFRERNGYWMRSSGPGGKRVSAVLAAKGLYPWNLADSLPRLWINPWAERPAPAGPFPTATVDEQGCVSYVEGTADTHELFDLPGDWPGPESPFHGLDAH